MKFLKFNLCIYGPEQQLMAVSTFRFVGVGLVIFYASSASAITSIKTVDLLHNQNASPFFTKPADGTLPDFTTYSNGGGTFTPAGSPRAGETTSITTNGAFSIIGNSTSAGNWTNGNGVPAGITLTFNVSMTYGVGSGSPPGSLLSLTANGINRGDGLGITQTFHGTHTVSSSNLNEVVGSGTDVFSASAVAVSNIQFTGSLSESGFTFTPGTVGNFGPYVLRSSGFIEFGETAGLVSETGPPDPLGLGRPTIGFGIPSSDSSEVLRGQGVVASHVYIDNNFGLPTVLKVGDYNGNVFVEAGDYILWRKGDLAADSNGDTVIDQADYDLWRSQFGDNTVRQMFPRQIGAWTLTPQNGTLGIKGIGYEYDVTFDITPSMAASGVPEPATATLVIVGMGMLAASSRRRFSRTRS